VHPDSTEVYPGFGASNGLAGWENSHSFTQAIGLTFQGVIRSTNCKLASRFCRYPTDPDRPDVVTEAGFHVFANARIERMTLCTYYRPDDFGNRLQHRFHVSPGLPRSSAGMALSRGPEGNAASTPPLEEGSRVLSSRHLSATGFLSDSRSSSEHALRPPRSTGSTSS
jgi:hypothetical protein